MVVGMRVLTRNQNSVPQGLPTACLPCPAARMALRLLTWLPGPLRAFSPTLLCPCCHPSLYP